MDWGEEAEGRGVVGELVLHRALVSQRFSDLWDPGGLGEDALCSLLGLRIRSCARPDAEAVEQGTAPRKERHREPSSSARGDCIRPGTYRDESSTSESKEQQSRLNAAWRGVQPSSEQEKPSAPRPQRSKHQTPVSSLHYQPDLNPSVLTSPL